VSKVELFEVIRREHFIQGKSIRRIAREQGGAPAAGAASDWQCVSAGA
jgi:hypothetical protein